MLIIQRQFDVAFEFVDILHVSIQIWLLLDSQMAVDTKEVS